MTSIHETLRGRIRSCENIDQFIAVYESPQFTMVLVRLRDSQLCQDRKVWARIWASSLASDDIEAWNLNHDRKTVTVFIFRLCDCWKKYRTVKPQEIIDYLGENRILQLLKHVVVMDRANSLYNLVDHSSNRRGMHWLADRDDHRQELLAAGVMDMKPGSHTMNKRYLWLMEDEDLSSLGLHLDQELLEWIQPIVSPLRINAHRTRAQTTGRKDAYQSS